MSQPRSSNTSSETPSSVTAKTAWAHKAAQFAKAAPITVLVGGMMALVVWGAVDGFMNWRDRPCLAYKQSGGFISTPTCALYTEIVNTNETREKGLSGRKALPPNHAMLFVFDSPGKYCFWMKDMHFPIDMMWLDDQKRIITIERTVPPGSYPKTFCPTGLARYVIETNPGVGQSLGWRKGSRVVF